MDKKIILIVLIAVWALSLFPGCASFFSFGGSPESRLRTDFDRMFADTNFSNAHWGVLIKSLKTGETVYEKNSQKMFMPASNMKLMSTSTGLTVLSPDFRYLTTLMSTDSISHDTLFGDVIFVGSGDPSITTRFNDSIATEVFQWWADSLRSKGISVIQGNLIGNDNCFDDNSYGVGWAADYETDWYAAQIGGICYNDNCIDVTLTADSVEGNPCSLVLSPDTKYAAFINQTKTVSPADSNTGIEFHRKRGTNTVTVIGSLSVGSKPWVESIAVDNPTLYALTVMKETFASKGISVTGSVVDIDDIDSLSTDKDSIQLASYQSPPLAEIVKATNKPSQNLYAEQIFRTIGAQRLGLGSMENARAVAYPVLEGWGVDTVRLRVLDGSGLSRLDLITPGDIVAILTGMYHGNAWDAFYESLPIAGVDGTIKNRMRGTKAEGNVHAKTGYIGYARSLSGYVTSEDGEMFVFSMIANNYTVPTRWAEAIQNNVCVDLAGFSRNHYPN